MVAVSLPRSVTTSRLTLSLISPEEAGRMRAGQREPRWHPDYPRQDDLDAASMVRGDDPWGPRHVRRTSDGVVFGSIGFFGPPSPATDEVAEVEIGFGLVADGRGRGVATEAVRALLTLTDALGVRVRASVSPPNAASLRVLAKCGFTELRGADEHGDLVMARPLPPLPQSPRRPSRVGDVSAPRPRLVATDLDGTLLRPDGTVSPRTRAVLTALDDLGVPVVFTTGRPIRWMEDLWADVGGHGLAICSNGGIVYDVSAREVARSHTMAVETLIRVATTLREVIPGTTFAVEKTSGFAREEAFMPRLSVNATNDVTLGSLETIADEQVVKLLARHEEIAPEAFWERVEESIGHLVTTTWSSVGTLVEMSAAGVTKASALASLAADLAIAPDEVIAFGDMPNDLPLLQWAGTSYAMANAHPTVLALADHVAPRNDEDGVATVLSRLFELSLG